MIGLGPRSVVTHALVGAVIALAPVTASAQHPSPVQSVGVVLSGGAAKGLAHVGVLRVLEEYGIPVHVVTGTSMGAIVGGLYAVGYTPGELDSIVHAVDWASLFSGVGGPPNPPSANWADGQHVLTLPLGSSGPRLPSNLVTGQAVFQLLARLTWRAHGVRDFSELRVPFAAIAADLESRSVFSMNPRIRTSASGMALHFSYGPRVSHDGCSQQSNRRASPHPRKA